jgi:hypothetical protein
VVFPTLDYTNACSNDFPALLAVGTSTFRVLLVPMSLAQPVNTLLGRFAQNVPFSLMPHVLEVEIIRILLLTRPVDWLWGN